MLSSVLGTGDASPFKVFTVCEGDGHTQKPRAISATDGNVKLFRGLQGSEEEQVDSARPEERGPLGKV